jgi:predicted transcriptional regulator
MQEQNQYPLADSKEIETDPGFVDLAALAAGGDVPVVDSIPSEPSAAEGSVCSVFKIVGEGLREETKPQATLLPEEPVDVTGLASPLNNTRQPAYTVQHEKPEHRLICWMKAAGQTNKEIADHLGLSTVMVGYVVNQPWAKDMMVQELRKQGQDEVQVLLRGEAAAAVQRLINISKTAPNEETKRKANNDILDRVYGKPNQPISQTRIDPSSLPDSELVKLVEGAKRNN